jgi:parallel beta-helix repeat protein
LKTLLPLILSLSLLLSMLGLAFYIQPVSADATVYIRADGSVEGTTNIYQVGNLYIFIGNINDSIVVEKSNIIIDGNGYTLQGTGSDFGVYLNGTTSPITGVIIRNTHIKNFDYGIMLHNASSYNLIEGNTITDNDYGIGLGSCSNNNITGNAITANTNIGIYLFGAVNCTSISSNTISNNNHGIALGTSSNNTISSNTVTTNNDTGIYLWVASNYNNISENIITNNTYGVRLWSSCNYNNISANTITENSLFAIRLYSSSSNIINSNIVTVNDDVGIGIGTSSNYNTMSENIITHNNYGIRFWSSSKYNSITTNTILSNNMYGIFFDTTSNPNTLYHNDFLDNAINAYSTDSPNVWTNGYPSGGNYWTGYSGQDTKNGPGQNLPGSDGIGDTPYIIGPVNTDGYPLKNPVRIYDVATTAMTMSKTVIGQGYTTTITITLKNNGSLTETFNAQIIANGIIIQTVPVTLASGNSTTITVVWNTNGWPKGSYQTQAVAARLPGETDSRAQNNIRVFGVVKVTVPGDVDGDRDIDIYDIVMIASAYGSKKGEPSFIPNADIDSDNQIKIYDIVIAASRYGYKG